MSDTAVHLVKSYQDQLREGLARVRETIGAAAERSGRSPDSVGIMAVTKGHPLEALQAALDVGIEDLGENRVSELERKREALAEDPRPRWHMVGHVQSRKAPRVRETAHVLHSLDSLKLAERFERTAPDGGEPLPVFVQVNTSGEDAKYGFSPEEFRAQIQRILELPSLRVKGLMTMAPYTDEESVLRTTFRGLRELQEEARSEVEGYTGHELSMGMSNDFEVAVEEGSTMVRLGTALLGERPG
jgi:PLP dependent protein